MFIVFDGVDGCGKTTQARMLEAELRVRGVRVKLTREPGGCAQAERVRTLMLAGKGFLPLSDLLLVSAGRYEHVSRTIRPFLEQGGVVISDRFADSSYAYQGAAGVDSEIIAAVTLLVCGPTTPDLTFILDIPPEAADRRIRARGGERTRFEQDREFTAVVRERFKQKALAGAGRYVLLNAEASPEALHAAVREHVLRRMA